MSAFLTWVLPIVSPWLAVVLLAFELGTRCCLCLSLLYLEMSSGREDLEIWRKLGTYHSAEGFSIQTASAARAWTISRLCLPKLSLGGPASWSSCFWLTGWLAGQLPAVVLWSALMACTNPGSAGLRLACLFFLTSQVHRSLGAMGTGKGWRESQILLYRWDTGPVGNWLPGYHTSSEW